MIDMNSKWISTYCVNYMDIPRVGRRGQSEGGEELAYRKGLTSAIPSAKKLAPRMRS